MPDEKKDRKEQEQHRAQTQTAKQEQEHWVREVDALCASVERAEHPRPDLAKIRAAYAKSRALAHKQAPKLAYSNRNVHLETKVRLHPADNVLCRARVQRLTARGAGDAVLLYASAASRGAPTTGSTSCHYKHHPMLLLALPNATANSTQCYYKQHLW
eukprot:2562035-Rhodomonas_salina.1